MNCAYENYLYIYNIKLIEENTLLIKKITFKHVFCFNCSKKIFYELNWTCFFVFGNKNCFPEFSSQIQFFFFWKHKKTILKNCFKKQQSNRPLVPDQYDTFLFLLVSTMIALTFWFATICVLVSSIFHILPHSMVRSYFIF